MPHPYGHLTGRLVAVVLALSLLSPALSPPARAIDEWNALAARAGAVAPVSTFLAAEVVDGACRPIASHEPDREMGIASTFKLYVLGELARQVADTRAAWEEALPVSDRWRSKASGEMRYERAGTVHTLRYFAERMVADSDNTATDHLIARLGRENVESMQGILGHQAPELNTPLLMTRELFALKTAPDEAPIDAYLAAADGEQRRFLDTELAPLPVAPEGWGDWNGPERIDLEWFASANDLCQAMARLGEMAQDPELRPVTQILGLNRGGDVFDARSWPYAGFKMGSEAGVYNLSWLLRRADGRVFVLTAGFNDPERGIDQGAAWALIERAEALLARQR